MGNESVTPTIPLRRRSIILFAVLLVAAFLRLYHFGDWLHFEVDQSRDAKVIVQAIDGGIGELPLLGPRAGGTFLRLGPGFYYLQYASALVFGMTPQGIAMGIALLSVASVAVFFVFVRRIFDGRLALGLSALFAVSEFFVVYGRFAWNPNPLPFFLLAGFYAFLRSVDGAERRPGRWFVLSVALLGFATHLHFLAFVSVPVIVIAFLGLRRPRFSWRAWAGAFTVMAVMYLPVVLNDIATGGANTQEFFQAVTGKSNKEGRTFVEEAYQDAANQAILSWTVLTGFEWAELPGLDAVGPWWRYDVKCDGGCRAHLVSGTIAGALWAAGLIVFLGELWKRFWSGSLVRAKRRTAPDQDDRDGRRSDALLLLFIWFAACSLLFLPLAFDFSPRFFLLIAPFPFVFLGLVLERFISGCRAGRRAASALALVVLFAFVASNLYFLRERFSQTARSFSENVRIPSDRILKERARVPLGLEQRVVDWMRSYQDRDGWPVYFYSEAEYRRAMRYVIESEGVTRVDVQRFYNGPVYAHGHYFVVLRSKSDLEDGLRKFREKFDVTETVPFGSLTGFVLVPRPESVTSTEQVFRDAAGKPSPSSVPERYTWRQWWDTRTQSVGDALDDDEAAATEE